MKSVYGHKCQAVLGKCGYGAQSFLAAVFMSGIRCYTNIMTQVDYPCTTI